jgi:pyruvate/2-oxoglutarate dehydrogenase complex dihydrolipoamide dehydrogenase (E3) component
MKEYDLIIVGSGTAGSNQQDLAVDTFKSSPNVPFHEKKAFVRPFINPSDRCGGV